MRKLYIMRILVDASVLTDQFRYRGVGNAVYSLLHEILRKQEHDWVLVGFGDKKNIIEGLGFASEGDLPFKFEYMSLGQKKSFLDKLFSPWFFYRRFLPALRQAKADYNLFPNFENGVPEGEGNIAMIHDLIPLRTGKYSKKSKLVNWIKKQNYLWALNKAKKAWKVVTISDFSAAELRKEGVKQAKLERVYLALSKRFSEELDKLSETLEDRNDKAHRRTLNIYNLTEPYIFYHGGLEANKNVDKLLYAFAKLIEKYPDLKLVIGGGEFKLGWDHKATPQNERAEEIVSLAKELKISHRVNYTGFIEPQHLPIVLANAEVFVHLSGMEGFGLAVLEAQAVGTPVVAANASTYPEILGESAVLVDPENSLAVSKAISELLSHEELVAEYTDKGLENIARFDWKRASDELMSLMSSKVRKVEVQSEVKSKEAIDLSGKKVAIVASYFHPLVGGMENVAKSYAMFMAEADMEVVVFTTDRKGDDIFIRKEEELELAKGKKILIKRLKRSGKNYYFFRLSGLFRQLKELRPEIVHTHSLGNIFVDIALWRYKRWAKKNKIAVKTINTPHGPFMAKPETGLRQAFKRAMTFIYRVYYPRLIDRVLAVNPAQFSWLEGKYGFRSRQIRLATPVMPQPELKFKELDEIKRKKGNIQISSISRLADYKGFDDIIAAFNEVNTASPTKLVIAGKSDNFAKEIADLIASSPRKDDIRFEKDISDLRRTEILRETDIFIFASQWEAFGIVLAEAMSEAAALISTKTEGGEFLIDPQKNGLLFDYKDYRGLIDQINKLLTNSEKLTELKKASYDSVKKYNYQKVKQNYLNILADLYD
ncbi:MAG: glycosyltransferase [Candidatus Dojkabacteria bacterium]